MKNLRAILTGLATALALTVVAHGPVHAQTQADDAAVREMRDMVVQPTTEMENRRAIQDFLARDEVKDVASSHGMSPEDLSARAATLDADKADDIANRISTLQDQATLAGGDTFVISATTVIIILLLLILIAVA